MLPAYAGPCLGSRPVAWLDGMVEILVLVEFTGRPAKLWSLHHIPGYRIFWVRCKALKPTSDSRLQDFLGTLQSFEAYTPKIPGQGYFIFPEIPGVHVNSP